MLKKRHKRIIGIVFLLVFLSIGFYLVLRGLRDNIVFFYPPSEINLALNKKGKVRMGGVVKANSVLYQNNTDRMEFVLTDYKQEIKVEYQGTLPALFREGQGIIAEGVILTRNNGNKLEQYFNATSLLAKHDEKYTPPEIAKLVPK